MKEYFQIVGKITYIPLETGFWGIITEDNKKYLPLQGLPANFQKEGLQIKAIVSPSTDLSYFMWGRPVEIKQIELLKG
ncbi:MAG: hypothetical protein RML72_00865 [Bacteroidia bacterium]|nr:hypothetical protein [Bacteroidia bacterium]MDW8157416.1 hypothetical protein [Bacteroidia bacterium]